MPNIEIDKEFLDLFYSITNAKPPKEPTLLDMKRQLIDVVDTLKELNEAAKRGGYKPSNLNEEEENFSGPAILIVDDLGVITYQLKVLLSQFDYDVDCSQEIYDAVSKYKKRKYDYVVMDLFIPTEREGFILLAELKKMAAASGSKTVVGVITASPRKEIEAQCLARGADFFLEKNNDWQKSLYAKMKEYINADKGDTEEEEDY